MDTITQHIFGLSLLGGKLIESRREVAQRHPGRRSYISDDVTVLLVQRHDIS
jgi:hypothetical protein